MHFNTLNNAIGVLPRWLRQILLVMRITTLILLTALLQVSASSLAQKISIDKKNASIQTILNEISEQSGYDFFYDANALKKIKPISINVKNTDLDDAIKKSLEGLPLSYSIDNKTVVIKEAKASLLDRVSNAVSAVFRNIDVRGRVLDEKGQPLPNASIRVKGKGTVINTNQKGEFEIKGLEENAVLVVSYVGYKTREVPVNNDREINIALEADLQTMDAVIVVGYSTQNRSKITGAVSQVGEEVFKNRPITNIAQGLQGAIPNVNITFGDGQLNRGGSFNIRGFTSITGGSALVLIDGTPGNINLVNPEDVESVSVLKDAASAAIYGARAAFGVILVTTKKGKTDQTQIRYTNNFGTGRPTRVPSVVDDPITAATIQNQAYRGYIGTDAPDMLNVISYLEQRKANPGLPELGVDASGNFIRGANTDWYKEFFNNSAPFSKNYLSIAGSKSNTSYFLSAGHEKQNGMFRTATDDYNRYSVRLKLDNQLADWIKVFNNAEFNQGIYDSPNKFVSDGGFNVYRYLSLYANPYEAIRTPNGNYTLAGMSVFGQLENAGRSINNGRVLKNTFGVQTNFLNNKLRINGDFTYFQTQSQNDVQYFRLKYENRPNSIVNFNNPDYYQATFSENVHQIINLFSEYEQRINNHHFKGLIGFNQELNKYKGVNARRDENITSGLGSINLTNGIATLGGSEFEWALRGVFGRINYDFKDRYLIEFNGRYDGTSRFASSSRFGFFPSVSAGWVLSKEVFFAPLTNTFDLVKFRGSYGSLGNQQVDNYAYISTMNPYVSADLLDLNGQLPLAIQAPGLIPQNLTWETSSTLNLGFDLSAFKSRLQLGFDWYDRKTTNMLTKGRTLPAVLGTLEPKANAADLSTKGWEFSVGWKDQLTLFNKPFSYNASFVLSDNRSVITRYDNPNKLLNDYYVGMEIGELWGFRSSLFQSDTESAKHADQSKWHLFPGKPLAGDVKFEDVNGDGVISLGNNTVDNPGDQVIIGNSSPRYSYGANLGFSLGNFSVDAFVQGIGKRDFWPGIESAMFWGFYNRWNQPVYDHIANNYWTPENTGAYYPRLRAYEALTTDRSLGVQQTRYLQDASYLRLKSLTIGYTLPLKYIQKVKMSNAKIFFSGQNLFESTRLSKAFDPEGINDEMDSSRLNGTGFVYPLQRTLTFGLEVNF